MGVILGTLYRVMIDGNRVVGPMSYNRIAQLMPQFAAAGVSVIQPQPVAMTQSGSVNNGDGYGLNDPYRIGTKKSPTYPGTGDELRRMIAVAAAWGIQVYLDVVFHQYDGGNNGNYTNGGGRFPKTMSCFVNNPPGQVVDDVFDSEGNFGFGDMVSMQRGQYNSTGSHTYMADGTIENLKWLFATLDAKGVRLDDTKGSWVPFIQRVIREACQGKFVYGECFDGNPTELQRWVRAVNSQASTVDFTLHWALQNICDNGNANMHQMNGAGFAAWDSFHAVTFTDNADTDTSNGQQIISNKLMAYAYILTTEGYPQIYYKDWSSDQYCYGLGKGINNLIWIHEVMANGTTTTLHIDNKVFIYRRDGAPGLITCLNFDTYNTRSFLVQTNWGANTECQDYTGNVKGTRRTDGQGRLYVEAPCDAYNAGRGYSCWGPVGLSRTIERQPFNVNQTFFGAEDLKEIGPASAGLIVTVGEIYAAKGTVVTISPTVASDTLEFQLEDINHETVPSRIDGKHQLVDIPADGVYTLAVGNGNKADMPFQVTVNYRAPKTLPNSVLAATTAQHYAQHAEINQMLAAHHRFLADAHEHTERRLLEATD